MHKMPVARDPLSTSAVIRSAEERDLPRLNEIYNYYVRTTPITFDVEPWTLGQRCDWFAKFGTRGRHRLFVVEDAGVVAGYAESHQFRAKAAYDTTVETTVYLVPESTGRGLGTLLYARLFDAIAGEDLRKAVAGVTLPNPASIALHERCGFTLAGTFHDVGRKFHRYWDVGWYEKKLS